MGHIETELANKESEIKEQIFQLAKNDEIWSLLMKWSCTGSRCGVSRNEDLAKQSLYEIFGYIIHTEEIIIENLRKDTLGELGKLLVLYRDKDGLSSGLEHKAWS